MSRDKKGLRDEINQGVPDTGIYKIDDKGFERESRSPVYKGIVGGMAVGLSLGGLYANYHSPLEIFAVPGDIGLVLFGFLAAGSAIGGAFMWLVSKGSRNEAKPPRR